MSAKEQLVKLVRIQEVVRRVRAARSIVDDAPVKLEEIEARFRERNAEYVAVKERHDALEADQSRRTTELRDLEEHRTKYMDDLMQVQNQREYAAMLKEIDTVKSQITENEEAIIHDMEELETVRGELSSHEEHIQEERELVKEQSAAVEKEATEARALIERLESERSETAAELPRGLIATLQRLEASRQGVFLARAVDGTCQSCFVRVRPQVFQEIRQAAKIHACSNCKRLLYHESLVAPASDSAKTESADKVQAVDGQAL